ncbi:MAG: outer membrane beta-barrel protein [Ignavibacteriae bacterium]|nr:outer membrane beta-barrel protein [Ignavibacteriota bacterium]
MKRILTIVSLFFLVTNLSFAQMDDMAVGLNGTLSVPIGDFNDIAKMGFGVSGTFYYDLSDNFQFTGTLGYLAWGGDKLNLAGIATQESKSSFTTIPVLAGFRYIFQGDNLLPYVSGELGLNVFTTPDIDVVGLNDIVSSSKGETNAYFGFGLGGGALYELSRDVKLDGSLTYNIINAENSIGFFSLEFGFIVGIN